MKFKGYVYEILDRYFDWRTNEYYNGGYGSPTEWSTTSTLPPGLSLVNAYYDTGYTDFPDAVYKVCVISGDLNIKNPSEVKNYNVNITATNAWGKTKGKMILKVVFPPEIDPEGTLDVTGEKSPLIATMGKAYRLRIPTNARKPYTWRLEYEGKDVKSAIGDSGLVWNAATGIITGAKDSMKPGNYEVTVYLEKYFVAKKTITITVNAANLEITNPKQNSGVATITNASVGRKYSFKPKAKGFGKFTWDLSAPDFLAINPSTGEISSSMNEEDIRSGLSGWSNITWNTNNSLTLNNLVLTVYDDYGQSASVTARLTIKGLKNYFDIIPVMSPPLENMTSIPENESADEYPNDTSSITSDDSQGLIVIRERDVSDLSTFALGHVSNDEYVIAAVLPEITVSESGQYDIDAVIDENIETGARLFWFAFPKDSESTSDDEIAEFYDESGEEIETVPESHEVTVGAWLTEGITYEPVIAVKRKK